MTIRSDSWNGYVQRISLTRAAASLVRPVAAKDRFAAGRTIRVTDPSLAAGL